MKILLVNYEYKGQGGGAGQQMYYLARALRDFGHDVSLLIGWDDRLGVPELLDGANTHIVKHKRKNVQLSSPLGMLFFVIRGLWCIKRLTKKYQYDIIQFYFSVPTGLLKYGISSKVPYVVSLRGMDIPGLQKDRNKGLSALTSAVNRRVAQNAAAAISNSSESAKMYNIFAPDIPIMVIPNAVDYIEHKIKQNYSESITRFVTIGRLIPWKRIDLLIESVSILKEKYPDITLDIYGQGYQYESLQQHITKNKAQAYISLKGYVYKPQLQELLRDYDVFVFASIGDSCPNVLIEAMACGLPVLAARKGGAIDIVDEGVTGVFSVPDDLNDTINKMEHCINNPLKMKEYGLKGRKRVEESFSIDSVAGQHFELFKKIVGKQDRET